MSSQSSRHGVAPAGVKAAPTAGGQGMFVIKRSGKKELVHFDKITSRISKLCYGLDLSFVDPIEVSQKVCAGVYKGVSSTELDELAAETAAHLSSKHPDYGLLAARVAVSNLHKNTKKCFTDVMQDLYSYVSPRTKQPAPLLSEKVFAFIMANKERVNSAIVYDRDYSYDYFGFKTLERSYLLRLHGKVAERPQHMLMRVSCGIHTDDIEAAIETYELLSNKWFTHASPTLFNAGTPNPQLASCFVAGTLVTTINRGPVPIEEVMVGDTVVTHLNRVRKVMQCHRNAIGNRKLFEIKAFGTPKMHVTGNHRLWSLSAEQKKWGQKPQWNEVAYLRAGDFIAIPNYEGRTVYDVIDLYQELKTIKPTGENTDGYDFEFYIPDDPKKEHGKIIRVVLYRSHLATEARHHRKREKPINDYITLDDEFARFLGIWYGDGCIFGVKNDDGSVKANRGISICSDKKNTKLIDFVKRVGEKIFGIRSEIDSVEQHNWLSIIFRSSALGDLFEKLFGKGFRGKRLWKEMYDWPKSRIEHFMLGLMDTDGCVSTLHIATLQLSNQQLMREIFHLSRRAGIVTTLTEMSKLKKGATALTARMNIATVSAPWLSGVFKTYKDDRLKELAEKAKDGSEGDTTNHRMIDGIRFVRLNKKVISDRKDEWVYTLGVEDDHSYAVNGLIAENCFLLSTIDDSIDGIFDTLKQCATISKYAGGIGLSVHNIRATGSYIRGTNGTSNGLIPMLRCFNAAARYVDQGGGKRKGSFAIYLEPWHADIVEFLQLKKNTGSEEHRARDLFQAMWVPDLFMKRVEESKNWSLFCPNEAPGLFDVWGEEFERLYEKYEKEAGRARKVMPARALWNEILTAQIETGQPFLLYKDTVNRRSNYKHIGTIRSSNLCVGPETRILTDKGQLAIGDLVDQKVNVWNGNTFSPVIVKQTGSNKKMVCVEFSDGTELRCTPNHRFLIDDFARGEKFGPLSSYTRYEAKDLKSGMKLPNWKLPSPIKGDPRQNLRNAYTGGVLTADATSLHPKFAVPINAETQNKLEWLAGLCDACATVSKNGDDDFLQIASVQLEFLRDVKLMLQTLGVQTYIHNQLDQKCYRLLISVFGTAQLLKLGFKTHRLKFSGLVTQPDANRFVSIVSVTELKEKSDTFCFNEKQNHVGIFNGQIASNCSEIVEFSSPDEIAVCNLASIRLPNFVNAQGFDFKKLCEVTKVITRNLNKVIDCNHYPVEQAKRSNLRHRPIGIGVQGLADTFALMRIPYESEAGRQLNRDIFEAIYFASLSASNELAIKFGAYESYQGSPMSQGKFHFDMCGVKPSNRWDWATLRANVAKHGVRNAMLVAPMPTASTSQILGSNESFEPFTSNIYVRRTLAGEFVCVNRYLLHELVKRGLWNDKLRNMLIAHDGSVQNIPEVPDDLKSVYKTVWEIKLRAQVDLAAERGAFIDQSQSFNVHMTDVTFHKLTSLHFYTWKSGLKCGMYYLRTQAAADAIKFTVDRKMLEEVQDTKGAPASFPDAKDRKDHTSDRMDHKHGRADQKSQPPAIQIPVSVLSANGDFGSQLSPVGAALDSKEDRQPDKTAASFVRSVFDTKTDGISPSTVFEKDTKSTKITEKAPETSVPPETFIHETAATPAACTANAASTQSTAGSRLRARLAQNNDDDTCTSCSG